MSNSKGSFAGFFPSAPSVQQQRRKRAALDRDHSGAVSDGLVNGAASPCDQDEQSSSNHGSRKRQRLSHSELEGTVDEGVIRQNPLNGETGDLPNGVGSASSLSSAVSSVFSSSAQTVMPVQPHGIAAGSHSLTPLTNIDSSPPGHQKSPRSTKALLDNPASGTTLSLNGDDLKAAGSSSAAITPDATPPLIRVEARPPPGETKGVKAIYDPELDTRISAKDKRKLKIRYRKFGEDEAAPPPDPRLAVPGYRDGELNIRLKGEAKMWKQRLRLAPYTLASYPWDAAVSIGLGPPTGVVVTGFDPFIPESQLRTFFGSYGDIAALESRTDPNTGIFLGVCSIRFTDSFGKRAVRATDAARRAEREGNGQRMGLSVVKVERDRTGRRCKRIVETLSQRNLDKRAQEQAKGQRTEDLRRNPSVSQPQPSPLEVPGTPAAPVSTPPPNAPKGPSGRLPPKPPEGPKSFPPRPSSLIEIEPILDQISRKPYVFISKDHVPVMGTTIPHLKKRLKMYDWREVRCDRSGYFIVFEDSRRGEEEAVRCFRYADGLPLFTYDMKMECQQYGNPNYERSPTPERVMAEQEERLEQERQRKEELMDLEVEKRSRAENLDPVKAAVEMLQDELREKIMGDIKTRIAVPALYDYLEPSRHAERRKKHGIADPTERQQAPALLSIGSESPSLRTPDRRSRPSDGFRRHLANQSIDRSSGLNVFADERRQRQPKRRAEIMPLHHRLHNFYDASAESDEEDKGSSREDTKEQESRSLSRMSSTAPSVDREQEVTPRKRRRIEPEEPVQDDESGDDDFGIAKSVLDPHVLKKEPEDMALRELQLIVTTLPHSSRLYKHAKKEMDIRQRNRDDDRLFHIKTEDHDEPRIEDAGIVTDTGPPEIAITTEEVSMIKSKKKPKSKRKTKKQIFEEREAAKAEALSAKALLQAEEAPTPETPLLVEAEVGKVEEEEESRVEVEWGVSAEKPRRTVEDETDLLMDIDGWQYLLKDDEDLKFMRNALQPEEVAVMHNVNQWATRQKEIKSLNETSGLLDDTNRMKGYYVPNATGCARTEGVQKILQSEKAKYLPHHLKIKEAREKRTQEAKHDPIVSAEEARKAKLASTVTSRSTRANNRTQVKDLNTVKQNLNLDGQGDAIRFNQLKKRKKLVRFDRSAIHGWGLYAEENIATSDMIIEYVGEKVRQAVANIREMKYDKQGMGSSYLFRIDEDTIVDATKKGGIARFINHSCAPNCTAKIIKVDGTKRIVIYALKDVAKNEELTYDYKFERELGNENRVICLCGAETCKGFLN